MRIVVTGAAGFIGSHLCEALLAEGHDVVGVDGFTDYYPRRVKERNLDALRSMPGFTFQELDLRTADLAPIVAGADVVVNEAAMPGLPRSWTDFDDYAGCNVIAVQRLLQASVDAEVGRFVQVSTSSVYGVEAVGDEDMDLRPVSPYGVTKLAAEHLVRAYSSSLGLPAVILRYFSIYGPRQRPDMAYHRFIEAMIEGRPITVYGDGHQSRSNTFVSDCVHGTVLAIQHAQVGETYNIGGGQRIELGEAIQEIARCLGVRPMIDYLPPRPGDQRHTAADWSKARDHLGYVPAVDPARGLAEQVEWHLSGRGAARESTPDA